MSRIANKKVGAPRGRLLDNDESVVDNDTGMVDLSELEARRRRNIGCVLE
jgi:hypothetical protein